LTSPEEVTKRITLVISNADGLPLRGVGTEECLSNNIDNSLVKANLSGNFREDKIGRVGEHWLEKYIREEQIALGNELSTSLHDALVSQPISRVDVAEIGLSDVPVDGLGIGEH